MTFACPWNVKTLFDPPATWPAPDFHEPSLQALFYQGPDWQNRATRIFAWLGLPPQASHSPVPGIVLVHGGGWSACAQWVRLWNRHGYAAIAMDTTGHIPQGENSLWQRHEYSGPGPQDKSFDPDYLDGPIENQWPYHAVAAIVSAHSLLRSLPQVDAHRIGITGVSWGGYLTCIAAAVDPRFAFAAPVYGCGFITEESGWQQKGIFEQLGPQRTAEWRRLWEPAEYLPHVNTPILWVSGANEYSYPLPSLQRSAKLPPGPVTLCLRPHMVHGHGGWGEDSPEIFAFADQHCRNGTPLPTITMLPLHQNQLLAAFDSPRVLQRASLHFTTDHDQPWATRTWQTIDAYVDINDNIHPAPKDKPVFYQVAGKLKAPLPDKTTACFFSMSDSRWLTVSSECIESIPSE